jgi:hypothetical protein
MEFFIYLAFFFAVTWFLSKIDNYPGNGID